MPIIPLDGPPVPAAAREPGPIIFTSTNLSRAYFPGWGILYSLLIHAFVLLGLIILPLLMIPLDPPLPQEWPAMFNRSRLRVVMYLPLIGGGTEGLGLPARKPEAARKAPAGSAASNTKGMSYPGPQPILSNPPNPTNRSQTILQPALVNPPILKPPLPLPNLVQVAEAGPVLQLVPEPPAPEPSDAVKPPEQPPAEPKPAVEPTPLQPIDASTLVLPASPTAMPLPRIVLPDLKTETLPARDLALLQDIAAQQPPPEPENEPAPETSAKLQERTAPTLSPVASRGTDLRNLLLLSPTPALPDALIEIPYGEARGQFAISPDANPITPETEPGTKSGTPAPVTVIGGQKGGSAPGSAPVVTVTFGSSVGTTGDRGASGGGTGTGSAPGAGSGSGSGSGTGSGTGAGSGSGAGSGPGKGPFAGITIVGGVGGTGAASSPAPRVTTSPAPSPRPLQTNYGLYVVSTEGSGGGLPFFDVFAGGQVYTVYLDMRETEMDLAPSWTLEFAVPRGLAAEVNPLEGPPHGPQGLVLPFPAVKERPALPAELVRGYEGRMIIVYGVINAEGRMEELSVKESPDPLLNEPVLSSLGKWVFRPALLNGKPVSVRLLLGIPLSLH